MIKRAGINTWRKRLGSKFSVKQSGIDNISVAFYPIYTLPIEYCVWIYYLNLPLCKFAFGLVSSFRSFFSWNWCHRVSFENVPTAWDGT